MKTTSRPALLARAFREAKLTIGQTALRPLTAGTLAILLDTGNPLFAETSATIDDLAAGLYAAYAASYAHPLNDWATLRDSAEPEDIGEVCAFYAAARRSVEIMFPSSGPQSSAIPVTPGAAMDALFEFLWIHSAPEEKVLDLTCDGDFTALRRAARRFAMSIDFDDLAAFQEQFTGLIARVNAALTESGEADDDAEPGKPVTSPAGSPLTSLPLAPTPIPTANTGRFGVFPSNGDSNTSTPPASPQALPSLFPPIAMMDDPEEEISEGGSEDSRPI
jgi:hypothetical protein